VSGGAGQEGGSPEKGCHQGGERAGGADGRRGRVAWLQAPFPTSACDRIAGLRVRRGLISPDNFDNCICRTLF
jgi:hypothetical protein